MKKMLEKQAPFFRNQIACMQKMDKCKVMYVLSLVILLAAGTIIAVAVSNILTTDQMVTDTLKEAEQLIAEMKQEYTQQQYDNMVVETTPETFVESGMTEPETPIESIITELETPMDTDNQSTIDNPSSETDHKVLGVIVFDSLGGSKVPIVEGASPSSLRLGAGHHSNSALPGESNNCLIFGHRDTVFKRLEKLKTGERIVIITQSGEFNYKIERMKVVEPNDPLIVKTYGSPMLTLVTCYPFNYIGSAPQRYVVVASLVSD